MAETEYFHTVKQLGCGSVAMQGVVQYCRHT